LLPLKKLRYFIADEGDHSMLKQLSADGLYLSSRWVSEYKGVSASGSRWKAEFNEIHLGVFDSKLQAAQAYAQKARGEEVTVPRSTGRHVCVMDENGLYLSARYR
jgi:hypothetical protein